MIKRVFKTVLRVIPRPLLIRLSYIARPVLALMLRGNNYQDPIDGRWFSKFLPYGYERQRENVLSPSTLSLERHRLLWLWLKRETDFFSAKAKLLNVAPEQAFHKRFRESPTLDYTTTDLLSPLADIKADLCALPFEDDTYDIILCNHVLEHIPDHLKAMGELLRVLKPGGWAVLQVPQELDRESTFTDDGITDPRQRAEIFGQYDHVRVYGRDYFDILRSVGFNVDAVDYTKQLTPEEVDRYRLAPGELLPVCHKPL